MARVASVQVQADHLERRARAAPVTGIAELIWNALDAEAHRVSVRLERSPFGAVETVIVEDDGHGIPADEVDDLFLRLGGSWKQQRRRSRNGLRRLHGQSGEGRFKAFSIGDLVTWRSVVDVGNEPNVTTIRGVRTKIDEFEFDEPAAEADDTHGTTVTIDVVSEHASNALQTDETIASLTAQLGLYIRSYAVDVRFDGERLDPAALEERSETMPVDLPGEEGAAELTIIEWVKDAKVERALYVCDEDGVALAQIPAGIHAPHYLFTAYVSSPVFGQLDQPDLEAPELGPITGPIISSAKALMRDYFKRRDDQTQARLVDEWKQENVYPFPKGEPSTAVERVEREVFERVAINVTSAVPELRDADRKSKKLTFKLLKEGIALNPRSMTRILDEVLDLPKKRQDELAALLERTPLTSLISLGRLVADRLDFVAGLEVLVFDPDSREQLKERSQLHRILANRETWIFGEEFAVTVDDQSLTEVLRKHLTDLGRDELAADISEEVLRTDGRRGIVDLMLSRAVPANRGREHLVIELKRPNVEVSTKELTQITSYAMAVAKDERFRDVDTRWEFIVVSNDLDDDVRNLVNQGGDRSLGLFYTDRARPLRVWAKTWGQVVEEAKHRLRFLQQGLDDYALSPERGLEYLTEHHRDHLPTTLVERSDDGA
jgi:hypothetical protein